MTYFISETYIKENTPLSQNVDIKDILPNIAPAQQLFIQVLIEEQYGTTFFNHLVAAYSAQTLSADETNLVALIKPALAYRAAEMALPFVHTQIKNKGIQSQSGDFSDTVGQEIMKNLRNELKNRAESYTSLLLKFMLKYKSLFAKNINEADIDYDKAGSRNVFDSGFVFTNYPNACRCIGRCLCGFYN